MTQTEHLHRLAAQVGVLTSYHDYRGQLQEAKTDVLLRVLRSLDVDIERPEDASAAVTREELRTWEQMLPPAAVAWDGHHVDLALRLPADVSDPYTIELSFETGDLRTHVARLDGLEPVRSAQVDGRDYVERILHVPIGALGYHRLVVRMGDHGTRHAACHIIAAPTRGYTLSERKRWGVFSPVYALRGDRPSGAGDLGDLQRLARSVQGIGAPHGASFVGTLPLLAAFLDEPFEPSPYSPVSRMFWNELYIDLETAPGLEQSPEAKAILSSENFASRALALAAKDLVDYRAQMAHKRQVIELLADATFASEMLRGGIDAYLAKKPQVADYAQFRAVTAARGKVWSEWPEPLRSGQVSEGDFEERERRYHIYAQYAMDTQLARFESDESARLYIDVPVGVNRSSYDVWRDREAFVLDTAVGAPPDALFTSGQNWGLPPLHPRRIRERGYRYFIDTIRHHAEHAGLLRIDHAMGLHRLFWIPEGVPTRDGVYVHYDAGEMYAIISLESHRNQCAITGEDLGTVPDYVRPSMHHHGMSRLYVTQFSLPDGKPESEGGRSAIEPPPVESVASLNTHDMPTLHGYWHGRDIDDFHDLGLYDADEYEREREGRRATCAATIEALRRDGLLPADQEDDPELQVITDALLEYLAASPARMIMISLEDLWLAPLAHNVPGTTDERPNWRRRMDRDLSEITTDEHLRAVLRRVAARRAGVEKK